jgi:hypothetical protein
MLNRAALILRYKQPFIDSINAADPTPSSHVVTLAEVNQQEHTVYLLDIEDEEELRRWLARHHKLLFEEELSGWYTDPKLWPRDRSLKVLQKKRRRAAKCQWFTDRTGAGVTPSSGGEAPTSTTTVWSSNEHVDSY